MPLQETGIVKNAARGLTDGSPAVAWMDASGATVTVDFYTKAILDGRGFQIRLGVLTTFAETDIEITTVKCEMSADSSAGHVLMPTHFTAIMESLSGGTLPDTRVMMTATASTAGTTVVPTPMKTGGVAASTTARAAAAGGVTIVDDTATTTRMLYGGVIAAVGNFQIDIDLRGSAVVSGAGNIYVVQGTVAAGVESFLALSYLEFTAGQLGL